MSSNGMIIGSLAPWFGGKRTLAPAVVRCLGPHGQYFEPFCGSCAVLFAKPPAQKETVNDLHGDVTNLARVVQAPGVAEQLYERLQRSVMCEGLLDDAEACLEGKTGAVPAAGERVGPAHLERAYWFFLASWMGRNGTAGTERLDYQIAVRWTKNGGSPTQRFRNAVESIPAWHERLRNVVVINRDAFAILDRFEDVPETAIYADPPYPAETRSNLGSNGGGGGRYLHEFNHGGQALFGASDDHARLAVALRKYRRARVVVSTYDCPRYRGLYAGWTFVPKPMQKNLHAVGGRGARPMEAPEVLIVNGPCPEEGA